MPDEEVQITILHVSNLTSIDPKLKQTILMVALDDEIQTPYASRIRLLHGDGRTYEVQSFQMLREDIGTNRRAFLVRASPTRFRVGEAGLLQITPVLEETL